MEDFQIIKLFFEKSEIAIEALSEKFGKYCNAIAYNILMDTSDAEECVNDAYLRVWNSIPPHKPENLKAYIGRIVRNLAIDSLDKQNTLKRGSGQVTLALDELSEVVGKNSNPLDNLEGEELTKLINGFLAGLPKEKRILFMRRYWYLDSVKDLAREMHMSESNVKTTLFRIRTELKKELLKEDINV